MLALYATDWTFSDPLVKYSCPRQIFYYNGHIHPETHLEELREENLEIDSEGWGGRGKRESIFSSAELTQERLNICTAERERERASFLQQNQERLHICTAGGSITLNFINYIFRYFIVSFKTP